MVTHLRTLILSSCITALAACGGGGGSGPGEDPGEAPSIIISNSQQVNEGQVVSLTPAFESGNFNDYTYEWEVISNHNVRLTGSDSPTVSFSAPQVSSGTTVIKLQLTVSNGDLSDVEVIDIQVNDSNSQSTNTPPTVSLGSNTTQPSGSSIVLSPSVSDDNTSSLTYAWAQISGSPAQITNTSILAPTVTLPTVQSTSDVVIRLTVSDGVNPPVSDEITITVLASAQNNPPIVSAGSNQTVTEGALVQLNGSVIDEGSPTLSWQLVSGPGITLSTGSTATPSFTAPSVDEQTTIVLRLTADDGVNPAVSSDVSITVNDNNVNNPPTVNAGSNQTVVEGGTFSLNPSISDDGNYSVQWSQVAGSPSISIPQPTQASQTLSAPLVTEDSTVVLRISVNDGENPAVHSEVSITITDIPVNNPPTVNAGSDRSVSEGSSVSLSGTVNDEGNPSVQWTQTSGTSVSISNANSLNAEFTAPNVSSEEVLEFTLTANDGVNPDVSDTVSITVVNIAAEVDAGDDISSMSGSTVTLTPEITGPAGYSVQWTHVSGPSVSISNATSETASFVAPTVTESTDIEIRLSVTFPGNEVLTDTLTVTVGPQVDVLVEYSATAKDDRLACYKGEGQVECNLRMYQVMAVSFVDGDFEASWGGNNNAFGNNHGSGDIQGIINSLDYIKDLGMNSIWITPLFVSNTNDIRKSSTSYFASNYFEIDLRFGTLDQARTLVEQAHARGMYVFFDGVFGHYYGPNIHQETYNGVKLPKEKEINVTNDGNYHTSATYPEDLPFFIDVATYWIEALGIDGWRLDLAYEVPVELWDDIREAVEQTSSQVTYSFTDDEGITTQRNPLGYMVGEVWRGAQEITDAAYGPEGSPALYSAFDFPMRYAAMQTFAVEESWAIVGSIGHQTNGFQPASRLHSRFLADHGAYPSHAMPNLMLSNHDILRFGDLLQRGEIADTFDDEYWERYKTVHSFQAAYSGPITVFYGEEIGQEVEGFAMPHPNVEGNRCDGVDQCEDHVSRISAQIEGVTIGTLEGRARDQRDYVRSLMNLREAHPALPNGSRTHIYSDDAIYIDRKDNGDDNILYMVNVTDDPVEIAIVNTAIGSAGPLIDLLGDYDIDIQGDRYYITLEGHTAHFFDIVNPTEEGPQQFYSGSLTGTGPLAACDAPDSNELDPIDEDIFIRGNYPGGDNFQAAPENRRLRYKGNNIYQVVVDEVPGTYGFKFANAGTSWVYEYATQGAAQITIGAEQTMITASGEGTESTIVIPQTGQYVFSFRINETLDGGEMMVSLCP